MVASGMTMTRLKQQPIRLGKVQKREVSTQFGALCYRMKNDSVQTLLVTTRRTQRWITPKGWPMDNATPAQTVLQEAYEEAGVEGRAFSICLGIYSYRKELDSDSDLPCVVAVFPVQVGRILKDYPEVNMRRRKWFGLKKASSLVREPELSGIIRNFDPSRLSE